MSSAPSPVEGRLAAESLPGPRAAGAADIEARAPLELFWRRFRRDKVAIAALVFIAVLVLVALFAPLIVKLVGARPPNEQSTKYLDSFGSASGPSQQNLFGTDGVGRDVFSRVLYGARVSLEVAFVATALVVVLGVAAGLIAGYYRGWVDSFLSRFMDVMLAFPVLLLALGLGAACSFGEGCLTVNYGHIGLGFVLGGAFFGVLYVAYMRRKDRKAGTPELQTTRDALANFAPFLVIVVLGLVLAYAVGGRGALIQPGLSVVIFIIALSGWPYMARIIRGQVLSLREKEFVEAAQSLGASDRRIVFRHILPNLVPPIIVYTTLILPTNVLFEAALSFLGVGVQPPQASWGAMISDATEIFDSAWWYMTFPGLALVCTVLAFNLVGDGLQDALDPRTGD